ncbi:MAG: FHA domain-containing protein [Actinomycetota bacterium]|nr:FHA domain-containing protein [Actinomycetota bacterium]
MSELGLTLARLAFLGLMWLFVLATVLVLRRDLKQPAEARPIALGRTPRPPRPPKVPKSKAAKVRGSKLIVTDGALSGTVIPLGTADVTIGRAPDSTVVVEDDYASSRHTRVFVIDGVWMVEDLGSTNGTWIDRTRITSATALPVGVPLRVGRTTLQLQK